MQVCLPKADLLPEAVLTSVSGLCMGTKAGSPDVKHDLASSTARYLQHSDWAQYGVADSAAAPYYALVMVLKQTRLRECRQAGGCSILQGSCMPPVHVAQAWQGKAGLSKML